MVQASTEIPVRELRRLATDACLACGASFAMATSLVDATVSAALHGRPEVGFAHLVDHLSSLREGRIDGSAMPRIEYPLPALILSDAGSGIAQLGFDLAFDPLVKRARTHGISIFTQKNSYTAGELGYYVRRLAGRGLISLAVANANALMAAGVGGKPVFGTNPLAFGAPLPEPRAPLVIDQSNSATAYVKIVQAAAENRPLPRGWAIDRNGAATTDAAEAMLGALLPFGGHRGANIALLVEVLAAGLSGAAWSLDAGSFREGTRSPNIGLTVLAISPDAAGSGFGERLADQLSRLAELGVHVPGGRFPAFDGEGGRIDIETEVLAAIRDFTR